MRIVHYEYKNTDHLNYGYNEIWQALVSYLRYIPAKYTHPNEEVLETSNAVISLMDYFITFGDTFLPQQNDYDLLFYQLIRHVDEVVTYLNYSMHFYKY